MTAIQLFNMLRDHKGEMLKVCFSSNVKTLKGVAAIVTKTTTTHAIAGIELANRKEIREAIEAGERGELGKLPWGAWRKGFYPFIIDHTPKGSAESVEYFRFYPPTATQAEKFNLRSEVVFTLSDGSVISREEAMTYCGAEAKVSESRPDCFSPRCSSVVSVG